LKLALGPSQSNPNPKRARARANSKKRKVPNSKKELSGSRRIKWIEEFERRSHSSKPKHARMLEIPNPKSRATLETPNPRFQSPNKSQKVKSQIPRRRMRRAAQSAEVKKVIRQLPDYNG
jgi:hypothetical protein